MEPSLTFIVSHCARRIRTEKLEKFWVCPTISWLWFAMFAMQTGSLKLQFTWRTMANKKKSRTVYELVTRVIQVDSQTLRSVQLKKTAYSCRKRETFGIKRINLQLKDNCLIIHNLIELLRRERVDEQWWSLIRNHRQCSSSSPKLLRQVAYSINVTRTQPI